MFGLLLERYTGRAVRRIQTAFWGRSRCFSRRKCASPAYQTWTAQKTKNLLGCILTSLRSCCQSKFGHDMAQTRQGPSQIGCRLRHEPRATAENLARSCKSFRKQHWHAEHARNPMKEAPRLEMQQPVYVEFPLCAALPFLRGDNVISPRKARMSTDLASAPKPGPAPKGQAD